MARVPLHLSTGIGCQKRQVTDERTWRYSPGLPPHGFGGARSECFLDQQ